MLKTFKYIILILSLALVSYLAFTIPAPTTLFGILIAIVAFAFLFIALPSLAMWARGDYDKEII